MDDDLWTVQAQQSNSSGKKDGGSSKSRFG